MITINKKCEYCNEGPSKNEELIECEECDFIGHEECLNEHYLTIHETLSTELNSDELNEDWEKSYSGEDF